MSVSIPERVWGGLEPDEYEKALRFFLVSIPERVWGGLEPDLLWAAQFDSQVVSIPERVWGGLERRASESLTVFGFRGTNARTLQV